MSIESNWPGTREKTYNTLGQSVRLSECQAKQDIDVSLNQFCFIDAHLQIDNITTGSFSFSIWPKLFEVLIFVCWILSVSDAFKCPVLFWAFFFSHLIEYFRYSDL